MSSKKDLRSLAAQFKTETPDTEDIVEESDVDTALKDRLAAATDPEPAPAPPQPTPPKTPRAQRTERRSHRLPPPVLRTGEPSTRTRMAVDVPAEFEPLRKDASAAGMTATQLVLSALTQHGPTLQRRGQTEALLLPPYGGVKKWGLTVTPEEREEIQAFAASIATALGRRSTAAAIVALLHECR